MTKEEHILTKKRQPRHGLCILVDNGSPCSDPIASRGLCSRHRAYLKKHRLLEQYALPRQSRKHEFELKENQEPGICRLIVNGKPCEKASMRRGLCNTHYMSIWQRPDLNMDDFAVPRSEIIYRKRSQPWKAGVCLIMENGIGCQRPVNVRGLCRHHYRIFSNTPERLDYWGLPTFGAHFFSRKSHLREGYCLVADNGKGCSNEAFSRGFCIKHYHILKKRYPILFEKWTLLPKKVIHRLKKKPPSQQYEGICLIIDNGVSCTRKPERIGICRRHKGIINRSQDYSIEDFALEIDDRPPVFRMKDDIEEGCCIMVEDDVECTSAARCRGLCHSHYNKLKRAGIFDDFAFPVGVMANRKTTPHLYLDKNLLFNYFAYEYGGRTTEINAVAIVQAVLRREFRATVSATCLTSLYNHIRHMLIRDDSEGGMGYEEEKAEAEARGFVSKLFFSGKNRWKFVDLTGASLAACVAGGKFEQLSLEDALEFESFVAARERISGPTLFVSSDHHFEKLECVHPAHVVKTYRSYISKMPSRKCGQKG